MESFEEIQKKEFEQPTAEIGTLGRRLVELGWSREQVLAYVKQLLNEPTGPSETERENALQFPSSQNPSHL